MAETQKQARIVRVGIIGCGEITQVAHITSLNALSHLFQITYLCDVSRQALDHCVKKVNGGGVVKTTVDAQDLCSSSDVDVVLIANADAYHIPHGILALQNDKFCLIEKPLSVCFRDLDRLLEVEKGSKGRVIVGTMRRFATAFTDAVEEVGGLSKIDYARVRDIVGRNPWFVGQSGMFPQKFTDYSAADNEDRVARETDIMEQALEKEFGLPVTQQSKSMLRVLGTLGTHDLSAMREILGMPKRVLGAFLKFPGIFAVLFEYDGFPVTYESGVSDVPEFDAHIEIYSPEKIVRVNFDTPYVKGLPTILTIREILPGGGFQERKVRKTYIDNYTLELLDLYECVVNGKEPKTSAADARNDIELFKVILQAGIEGQVKIGCTS